MMKAQPAASKRSEMSVAVMRAAPRSAWRSVGACAGSCWSILLALVTPLPGSLDWSVLGQVGVAQSDGGGELDGGRRLVARRAGRPALGQIYADGDDDIPGASLVGDFGGVGRDLAVVGRVGDLVAEVGDGEVVHAVGEDGDARAGVHVEPLDVAVGAITD